MSKEVFKMIKLENHSLSTKEFAFSFVFGFLSCFVLTGYFYLSAFDSFKNTKLADYAGILFLLLLPGAMGYLFIKMSKTSKKKKKLIDFEMALQTLNKANLIELQKSPELTDEERSVVIFVLNKQYEGWSLNNLES